MRRILRRAPGRTDPGGLLAVEVIAAPRTDVRARHSSRSTRVELEQTVGELRIRLGERAGRLNDGSVV
jgi:hypothetical protein